MMTIRYLRVLPVAVALATLLSCATAGGPQQAPSMPAARAALRPEYRLFYDALQDYGDWVLIEPFGFVYRPKVDFATFHPYQEGIWVPSDSWGWVWISAEPFGWATYHYGTWFWDRFQGWVWSPGLNWGPAWVSWQVSDRYAGWAPLAPQASAGLALDSPGGAYRWAPLALLGSTEITSSIATKDQLGLALEGARPVDDAVERDGMRVHMGPSLALVERARGGPLPTVKFEDALGAAVRPGAGRREEKPAADPTAGIEAARRAGEASAVATRALIERGGRLPQALSLIRPAWLKAPVEVVRPVKRPGRAARGGANPDSAR